MSTYHENYLQIYFMEKRTQKQFRHTLLLLAVNLWRKSSDVAVLISKGDASKQEKGKTANEERQKYWYGVSAEL